MRNVGWLSLRTAWLLAALTSLSGMALGQDSDTVAVSAEEQQAAQDTADGWIALIDSMEYAASWERTSAALRQQVTQIDWEQTMRSTLSPLGPLLSRTLQGREYTTTLPGAPEGEYIVITYGSTYTQLENAVETLVMVRNPASEWKPAGYYVRPAP